MAETPDRVRLDKWLWAARFYKTRGIASEAIDGGKVDVNGQKAKRAKEVKAGDEVSIRQPPFETVVIVKAVSLHRGSATIAHGLYEETDESRQAREKLAAQIRAQPQVAWEAGKPTKRDRRDIDRFRGR